MTDKPAMPLDQWATFGCVLCGKTGLTLSQADDIAALCDNPECRLGMTDGECPKCKDYVGKCPYCHSKRPAITAAKEKTMYVEETMETKRLRASNKELLEALKELLPLAENAIDETRDEMERLNSQIETLRASNAELVAALMALERAVTATGHEWQEAIEQARAAITAAKA
jgi:hypothetical protein